MKLETVPEGGDGRKIGGRSHDGERNDGEDELTETEGESS